MAIGILFPALSPTMTQGHLVKWHKNVGDEVRSGDLLLEVETDKAVMEVEATQGGILDRVVIEAPAENVPVGTVVAFLRTAEEPAGISFSENLQDSKPSHTKSNDAPPKKTPSDLPEKKQEKPCITPQEEGLSSQTASGDNLGSSQTASGDKPERIASSPLARQLARDKGVDIQQIQRGTGPGGRIVARDVENFLKEKGGKNLQSPYNASNQEGLADGGKGDIKPLSPMRKIIAERLSWSKQNIPHFYLFAEVQMDGLVALREILNTPCKRFSVNDFVLKACALALKDVPEMRLSWCEEQGGLLHHETVGLAVAVALEGGLITPLIFEAEKKSLTEMAQSVKDLAARARLGQLRPHEYQGGIFTVSNLGMYGIDGFHAIINPPHSGILAVGAVQEKPWVKEGKIVPMQLMQLSLAADHRVVDGEGAARFLMAIKQYLEHPYTLLS